MIWKLKKDSLEEFNKLCKILGVKEKISIKRLSDSSFFLLGTNNLNISLKTAVEGVILDINEELIECISFSLDSLNLALTQDSKEDGFLEFVVEGTTAKLKTKKKELEISLIDIPVPYREISTNEENNLVSLMQSITDVECFLVNGEASEEKTYIALFRDEENSSNTFYHLSCNSSRFFCKARVGDANIKLPKTALESTIVFPSALHKLYKSLSMLGAENILINEEQSSYTLSCLDSFIEFKKSLGEKAIRDQIKALNSLTNFPIRFELPVDSYIESLSNNKFKAGDDCIIDFKNIQEKGQIVLTYQAKSGEVVLSKLKDKLEVDLKSYEKLSVEKVKHTFLPTILTIMKNVSKSSLFDKDSKVLFNISTRALLLTVELKNNSSVSYLLALSN